MDQSAHRSDWQDVMSVFLQHWLTSLCVLHLFSTVQELLVAFKDKVETSDMRETKTEPRHAYTVTFIAFHSFKTLILYLHYNLSQHKKTNHFDWCIVLVDNLCISVLPYSGSLWSLYSRILPVVHKLYLNLLYIESLSSDQNLSTHTEVIHRYKTSTLFNLLSN